VSLAEEFKSFIMKGNVIDLAVAVVIGVAFNSVVNALVADIVTPLIGVPGHFNFAALNYTVNGSVFAVGHFLNALVNFLTIALVVFLIIVKPMSKFKKEEKADTMECPECKSKIPKGAKRCAFCTAKLK